MNLEMNETSWGSGWRDLFRIHAPITDRHRQRSLSTNGEVNRERFYREWFAQQTWEDDGGRVGPDVPPVVG